MTLVATADGRMAEIYTVAPDAQTSTNATVVLDGSEMDVRPWKTLAYTLSVITNTITYTVFGANLSTYADEVIVQAATDIAAAANGSYAIVNPPYAYYRVKILTKVNPNHGVVTLNGIAKN
jgi:hypothetical protein